MRQRRLRVALLAIVLVALIGGVAFASCSGGASTSPTTTVAGHGVKTGRSTGPASIEAGVEPWQMSAPLSRESVVANAGGLTVLGGITPSGSSLATVSTINPTSGAIAPAGSLADPVHDAAASVVGVPDLRLRGWITRHVRHRPVDRHAVHPAGLRPRAAT